MNKVYFDARVVVGNYTLSYGYYGQYCVMRSVAPMEPALPFYNEISDRFEDGHVLDVVYASLTGKIRHNKAEKHDWQNLPWWVSAVDTNYINWRMDEEGPFFWSSDPLPTQHETLNERRRARVRTLNGNYIVAYFNGTEFNFYWANTHGGILGDATMDQWLWALTWGVRVEKLKP